MSLSGQVVQSKGVSGFGFTSLACDGTEQPYTIDVSSGGGFLGFSTGAFKPGKASAQVTTSVCEPPPFPNPFPQCSTRYTDAIIRLER